MAEYQIIIDDPHIQLDLFTREWGVNNYKLSHQQGWAINIFGDFIIVDRHRLSCHGFRYTRLPLFETELLERARAGDKIAEAGIAESVRRRMLR